MKIYLDTSAIVKYFHEEEGASQVIEIIDDPENTLWISELAVTEFLSAFHRKCRMGEINPEILQTVDAAFQSKISRWNIEPFSTLQTEEAQKIIMDFGRTIGIRTLDALHLLRQEDWVFVVADRLLNNVTISTGVTTIFIGADFK